MNFFDLLAARVYFGTAPVFIFSIVIYIVQTLVVIYLYRSLSYLQAVGLAALFALSSYSSYELAFKLSFLLFGQDRVDYFFHYDLYPTALLLFGVVAILAVRNRLNFRYFVPFLCVFGVVWAFWIVSGNYPLDVQAFEADPGGLPLLFNFVTKVSVSFSFVAAATPNRRQAENWQPPKSAEAEFVPSVELALTHYPLNSSNRRRNGKAKTSDANSCVRDEEVWLAPRKVPRVPCRAPHDRGTLSVLRNEASRLHVHGVHAARLTLSGRFEAESGGRVGPLSLLSKNGVQEFSGFGLIELEE